MVKKLIFIIVSFAIVLTGAYAFRKLNYWERSIYIFDYREMDRRFESRGGRGSGRFDDRSREDFERRGDQRGDGEMRERSEGDFRVRPDGEFRERPEGRSSFGPGDRGRGGHGRGDFHGGKQVRLRNVGWFLVVFMAFTVVSIYLDRAWVSIRKKRKRSAH